MLGERSTHGSPHYSIHSRVNLRILYTSPDKEREVSPPANSYNGTRTNRVWDTILNSLDNNANMRNKLLKLAIQISDEIDIAIQKRTKVSIKQKALEKKMDLGRKKNKTLDKALGVTQ